MKDVGQYLQKYQIDSDDDNITYHPLLCSSFYQNSLKKLFDVFYSPPFTTVPSPVPLLLFSHEVTPTRHPLHRPRRPPHQSRAPSDQVLTLISDLSGAVTSDWTSPVKILSPSDSQKSALNGGSSSPGCSSWDIFAGSSLSLSSPRGQSLDLFLYQYLFLPICWLPIFHLSSESIKNEKAGHAVVDGIIPPPPPWKMPMS